MTGLGGGGGPASLEDMLKRRQQISDTQSRPVFMSKKKREALKKLEEEEEEKEKERKRKEKEQQQAAAAPAENVGRGVVATPAASDPPSQTLQHRGGSDRAEKKTSSVGKESGAREWDRDKDYRRDRDNRDNRDHHRRDRDRHHGYRRNDRNRDRDYRGGDRDRDRGRGREDAGRNHSADKRPAKDNSGGGGGASSSSKPNHQTSWEKEKERELENIKQQYLGGGAHTQKKRKISKASDKHKFKFDWDATEDTSRDLNSLYENPHEATLLFGRGQRAGGERSVMDPFGFRRGGKNKKKSNDFDTHWTAKAMEDMNDRDWRIFREDHNISYKGAKVPKPFRSWDDASKSIPASIMKGVYDSGYQKPSPIQMAAMPIGLQQRDVIGVAETGSGKTCAFVLPMLTYISKLPPMTEANIADGPYAVVMAPTRELAQQIEEETVKFARHMGYKVVCVVGGQSITEQGVKLRQGCEIVIATPGRLLDCLNNSYAVLNQCNYVVLDEADRMIDMGFEPQVQGILDAMPSTNLKPEDESVELEKDLVYRTTYMFSATMPPAVERLAKKYLRRPVVVTIGRAGKAGANVTQEIRLIKENAKPRTLERELRDIHGREKQCIVFVNTKSACNTVSRQVERLGFYCVVLHGGKAQDQREAAIKDFKTKKCNILVATDVAGRGIDVADVTKVINYDMPNNIEAYTHRIGRTGRAGKTGQAVSLLTMADQDIFYELVQLLKDAKQQVPRELAKQEAARTKPGSFGGKGRR